MARSAIMNVMVQTALKAGRALLRYYSEIQTLQVSLKGPSDYVSQADQNVERLILRELMKARPHYSFLTEETGEICGEDSQHRFIIDPLDGTTNFLHAIPFFGVSIALERQGQIVAGVIYNPILDELFTAEKGDGAFLNDRRMRVANRRKLQDCVICTGIPHLGKGHHGQFLIELRHVMQEVAGIRRTGSAALDLAYVAAGRFDGFFEDHLKIWDMAAGLLMVKEAGGFVSDKDGGQDIAQKGHVIAGNEIIHKALKDILHKPI